MGSSRNAVILDPSNISRLLDPVGSNNNRNNNSRIIVVVVGILPLPGGVWTTDPLCVSLQLDDGDFAYPIISVTYWSRIVYPRRTTTALMVVASSLVVPECNDVGVCGVVLGWVGISDRTSFISAVTAGILTADRAAGATIMYRLSLTVSDASVHGGSPGRRPRSTSDCDHCL